MNTIINNFWQISGLYTIIFGGLYILINSNNEGFYKLKLIITSFYKGMVLVSIGYYIFEVREYLNNVINMSKSILENEENAALREFAVIKNKSVYGEQAKELLALTNFTEIILIIPAVIIIFIYLIEHLSSNQKKS